MENRSIENDGNPELQLHIWLLSCVGRDHRRVDLPSHAWSRGNQSRYRTGLLRCPFVHLLPGNSGALECLGASRFIQVARPWWFSVPLCTALALVLAVQQYAVSEALYGIEGTDGPFSQIDRI
jgi:hypothetical protein